MKVSLIHLPPAEYPPRSAGFPSMVRLEPHDLYPWHSDATSPRSSTTRDEDDTVQNGSTEMRARAAHGGQLRRYMPTTRSSTDPKASSHQPTGRTASTSRVNDRALDQVAFDRSAQIASQTRAKAVALLTANEARAAYRRGSLEGQHLVAPPADQVIEALSGPQRKIVKKQAATSHGLRKTRYVLPPEYLIDDDTAVDEVDRVEAQG